MNERTLAGVATTLQLYVGKYQGIRNMTGIEIGTFLRHTLAENGTIPGIHKTVTQLIGSIIKNQTLTDENADQILVGVENLRQDIKEGVVASWIATNLLALILLVTRLYSRWKYSGIRRDDWYLVAAYIFALAFTVSPAVLVIAHHFDHHVWDVTLNDIMWHMKLTVFDNFTFFLSLGFLRTSFSFMYYDLYPSKRFRLWVIIYLIFMWVGSVAMMIAYPFKCRPLDTWNHLLEDVECVNFVYFANFLVGFSVLMDLVLLIQPIFILRKLQVARKREKIVLGFLFGLGGTVVILGVLKLWSLNRSSIYHKGYDSNWDAIPVTTWSVLELNLGVVCATIPALRKLIIKRVEPAVEQFVQKSTRVIVRAAGLDSIFVTDNKTKDGTVQSIVVVPVDSSGGGKSDPLSSAEKDGDVIEYIDSYDKSGNESV